MPAAQDMRIAKNDKRYPPLLLEIADPPEHLYIRGVLPPEDAPAIAIVGTRKATRTGEDLARRIAAGLARRGIIIVSGLAVGIDAAAHEGAVKGGAPTVAVLAGGVESYPQRNKRLAEKIIESGGALISEEENGIDIQKYHFLRRNRIVAGLAKAVIIIEAPAKSGSLVTARLAAESGRDALVFPGPISHPNYKGSHALIRDGARLVSSLEDILEDMGIESATIQAPEFKAESLYGEETSACILRTLRNAGEPLSIDKIVRLAKLEPQAAATNITLLVLNGQIKETERGYAI